MDNAASSRRVVVTGLGVVASLGHDTPAFWASLVAGRCGIKRVSLFDPKDFASQIGAEVRDWVAANLPVALCNRSSRVDPPEYGRYVPRCAHNKATRGTRRKSRIQRRPCRFAQR